MKIKILIYLRNVFLRLDRFNDKVHDNFINVLKDNSNSHLQ